MVDQIKKNFRFILGLLFSLAVIVWFIKNLDWQQVWLAFIEAQYGWVTISVILTGLLFMIRTSRWAVLLWPQTATMWTLFSALIIGQTTNYLAPIRAGDLVRAYLVGEMAEINKGLALGTIALEKLWDLVMLMVCIVILSILFPLPDWLLIPSRGLGLMTFISLIVLGILVWQQEIALQWMMKLVSRLKPGLRETLLNLMRNILAGFASIRNLRQLFWTAFWSILTWMIGGLTNYVLFLAFDLSLSLLAAFLLLVVLQVGVALPSLPGRVGIFQGLCILVLALFGISGDVSFSYGVILHLVVFLPPILLAAILSLGFGFSFKVSTLMLIFYEELVKH